MEDNRYHIAYFRTAVDATDLAECEDIVRYRGVRNPAPSTPAAQLFSLIATLRPDFTAPIAELDTPHPVRLDVLLAQTTTRFTPQVYLAATPCRNAADMTAGPVFSMSPDKNSASEVHASTARVVTEDSAPEGSELYRAHMRGGFPINSIAASPGPVFNHRDRISCEMYPGTSPYYISPVWQQHVPRLDLWEQGPTTVPFFGARWHIPGHDFAAESAGGLARARWTSIQAGSEARVIVTV